MKYTLILLSFMMTLYSCSSGPSKGPDPLDEYKDISNEDFNRDDVIPYSDDDDLFKRSIENDVVARESASREEGAGLDNINSADNPLFAMTALCYQKQYEQALEMSTKIYDKYKKNPSYWNQLGNCHLLKGNERKALLYYNKALDTDKDYAPPFNNIGVIHLRNGDDRRAMKSFEQAAENNPYSLTPLFNLAHLYLEYGLVDNAKKYFQVLANKGKKDNAVLAGLATTYLFEGNVEMAIAEFEKIANRFLREPYIGLNYSVALKLGLKESEAKSVFNSIDKRKIGENKNYYNKVKTFLGL